MKRGKTQGQNLSNIYILLRRHEAIVKKEDSKWKGQHTN